MNVNSNNPASNDGLAGSPATRGSPAQTMSAVIGDAFGGSSSVTFSGDWLAENFSDAFDRGQASGIGDTCAFRPRGVGRQKAGVRSSD